MQEVSRKALPGDFFYILLLWRAVAITHTFIKAVLLVFMVKCLSRLIFRCYCGQFLEQSVDVRGLSSENTGFLILVKILLRV